MAGNQVTQSRPRTFADRVKSAIKAFKSTPPIKAFYSMRAPIFQNFWPYAGEKTLGELGPSRDYFVDYASFRSRGKQFYLDNEVAQMIINAMSDWVIGNGLRLEAEPNEIVLKSEGISINVQEWSDQVEARYSILKEQKETTFSRMRNLSEEESRAFTNGNNCGGILVVLRVRNAIVNYEIIDGSHVRHPAGGSDLNPTLLPGGLRIQNGIELNDAGEHIAFWVMRANWEYVRIPAKSASSGFTTAFMYGGRDYMIDNSRTLPILAGLFQTLQQMDDYKTATLGSAKAQNDQALQLVTDVNGDNNNVFGETIARAADFDPNGQIPHDNFGQTMANKVAVETGKNVYVPSNGQRLEPIAKNEAELYFEQFWRTLFECACAAAGMPPNVVLKRFDTSFSSARAAIKDWAHSLLLKRYKHGLGFLQPGYELQLHLDILTGKIQAPGYLIAFKQNDIAILGAYRKTRWVGDNVPEIDELKEVKAVREALGTAFDHVPLISVKNATEGLNFGNSKNNIIDNGEVLKQAEAAGIKPVEKKDPSATKAIENDNASK